MSLQKIIEFDFKQALKDKNAAKRDLLGVLITEFTKKGKEASDEEVVRCIKKQIESAKLCNTLEEIPLLEVYLPREISDEELIAKLAEVKKNGLPFGDQMKLAKEILGSDFDGKRVSAILKLP